MIFRTKKPDILSGFLLVDVFFKNYKALILALKRCLWRAALFL